MKNWYVLKEAPHESAYHQNYDKVRTEEQQYFVNVSLKKFAQVRFKFKSDRKWEITLAIVTPSSTRISASTFFSIMTISGSNKLHNELLR